MADHTDQRKQVLGELYALTGRLGYERLATYGPLSKSSVGNVLKDPSTVTSQKIDAFIEACLGYIADKRNTAVSGEEATLQHWRRRYDAVTPKPDVVPADEWAKLVVDHRAWDQVDGAGPFADHASAIARELFELCGQPCPDDPWRDDDFPRRFTENLTGLAKIPLTGAEAALVTLVPLAYEAETSRRVGQLLHVEPKNLAETGRPDTDRLGYESFLRPESNQRLVIRAAERGLPDRDPAPVEIGWWLYHQWLVSTSRASSSSLFKMLAKRPLISKDRVRVELVNALARLMRIPHRPADELRSPSRLGLEQTKNRFTMSEHPMEVREQLIGLMTALAHALACKPTLLSRTIVEHLGIPNAVDLSQLMATLAGIDWHGEPPVLRLHASCHHEAVLEALKEQVVYVDAVLGAIHTAAMTPLRTLHSRASAEGVEPAEGAFATPVDRFRLDEERIRELLMGTQLYRDPSLAIRELYQNALDACRYRKARHEYLAKRYGVGKDYRGEIKVRQGFENRRHFLECSDDGIGMGEGEFRGAFSKAGVRFTDRAEFQEEQEEWREYGVRLYPNSRFGIGVLSYFMLADEIEVTTRRMPRDHGRPEPELRVTIAGPGHYFRITKHDTVGEPGTRVRLYLRDGDKAPSCVEVLQQLLGIAEFTTTAQHTGEPERWEAGVLATRQRLLPDDDGIDVSGRLVVSDDGEVVWCEHGGALLVDGIYVKAAEQRGVLADPNGGGDIRGVVVNLKGEGAPRLSVDRTLVLTDVSDRVERMVCAAVSNLVHDAPGFLSFGWIRHVARTSPTVADIVIEAMARAGAQLRHGHNQTYNVASIGHFVLDWALLTPGRQDREWSPRTENNTARSLPDVTQIPDHIMLWRVLAHRAEKLVGEIATTAPELSVHREVLTALPTDSLLLAGPSDYSSNGRLSREDQPPPGRILWVALNTSMTPREVAQRAVDLGAVRIDPQMFAPDKERLSIDMPLLSKEGPNSPVSWLTADQPVALSHIIESHLHLHLAISDVVTRLASFGFRVSQSEHFAGRLERVDLRLINDHLTYQGEWLKLTEKVSALHVLKASQLLGPDAVEIVDQLQSLGFEVDVPERSTEIPTAEEWALLSEAGDGRGPWLNPERPVPVHHLVRMSTVLHIGFRDAARRLDARGFTVRRLDSLPESVTDEDRKVISHFGNGDEVTEARLTYIGRRTGYSPREVAERLAKYGYDVDAAQYGTEYLSSTDLLLASSDLDGEPPWLGSDFSADVGYLVYAAMELGLNPSEVADSLVRQGIGVEDADSAVDELTPADRRLFEIVGRQNVVAPQNPISLQQLISGSVQTGMTMQEVAERLRALGLNVPDLAETLRKAYARVPWRDQRI